MTQAIAMPIRTIEETTPMGVTTPEGIKAGLTADTEVTA